MQTFEVRFQELRVKGDHFDENNFTKTDFEFAINRNPNDSEQTFVGVSATTIWGFTSGSRAILQCTCGVFPQAFLITDLSYEEFLTSIQAAIGQINLDLPKYLKDSPLPNTLQIEDLDLTETEKKIKELYDKLQES